MPRALRPLALLVLAAAFAACDSAAPPPQQPAAVAVGATYDASTFAMRDAETAAVVFDYLDAGAVLAIEFVDSSRFEFTFQLSESVLIASGETEDLDGDIDEVLTGTYTQTDGTLTFELDTPGERFILDGGWAIDADGGAIRYQDEEDGLVIDVVLTRG